MAKVPDGLGSNRRLIEESPTPSRRTTDRLPPHWLTVINLGRLNALEDMGRTRSHSWSGNIEPTSLTNVLNLLQAPRA